MGANVSNIQPDASVPAAALLLGVRWNSGPGTTQITYSFAGPGSAFGADQAFGATVVAFSAEERALTRAVLDTIEAVCDIRFTEVADGASDLRYGYSDRPNELGFSGFAFFPSQDEVAGNVWLGRNQAGAEWNDWRPYLVLHETLHALGLKHPFEGTPVLPAGDDVIRNTVMSYSAVAGYATGAMSAMPREPMALDVAALQALYGAGPGNAGDTRYDLAGPAFQGYRAIWDSQGSDTLDASNCAQGVRLDLRAGARSDVGAQVQAFGYVNGSLANGYVPETYSQTLAIADGAAIENAVGSAFADWVQGNALANLILGGAGDDVLVGGGGFDRLYGEAGDDTLQLGAQSCLADGGAGFDIARFEGSAARYQVQAGGGGLRVADSLFAGSVYELVSIERLVFSDGIFTASPSRLDELPDQALAQAARLYRAAFQRSPDEAGLAWHAAGLAGGKSLTALAGEFLASPEYQRKYATPQTDIEYVQSLYRDVLGRDADPEGLAWQLGALAVVGRAGVLAGFSESPENQVQLIGYRPESADGPQMA